MKHGSDTRHRRSIRLKGYDYSQNGAYFITVCTQNRAIILDNADIKSIVQKWWNALPEKFPAVRTDRFVIMPNHIHGIIFIDVGADHHTSLSNVGADQRVCPLDNGQSHRIAPTLGTIVQWFKTMTTNEYFRAARTENATPTAGKLWQRNYYERIIRNETDLHSIREYIIENPSRWQEDADNPKNIVNRLKNKALVRRNSNIGGHVEATR